MINTIENFIKSDEYRNFFIDFYGEDEKIINLQIKRYKAAVNFFKKYFKNNTYHLFNTPGRTEIIGNHTDHNLGKVITGSINLDAIAVANINNINKIRIYSKNYNKLFEVNLSKLDSNVKESNTTDSLIRGIAVGFTKNNFKIGGFNAFIDSDVMPGSGLSSSACFEILIGTVINALFNDKSVSLTDISRIGQFAENNYMKKPSGLMDQIACAFGGIVKIDFKEKDEPRVNKVNFNLSNFGYSMLILDSGASHENLTSCYADIPYEMKSVSGFFKKECLREVIYEDFKKHIKILSSKFGDRAVLRSIHFFEENLRVDSLLKAIINNDIISFLSLINESGNSSCNILQNCFNPENPKNQKLLLALTMTNQFIKSINAGACRVHGGGFAGTIQVFIPTNKIDNYKKIISPVFGEKSIKVLNFRNHGTMMIF
jgi:galactokinase